MKDGSLDDPGKIKDAWRKHGKKMFVQAGLLLFVTLILMFFIFSP